ISHATEDDAIADKIFDALSAAGLRVWLDHREGIPYGKRWERVIREAIKQSKQGLFLMSRCSLNSDYCNAEWHRIIDLGKKLYVALLEPIPIEDTPLLLGSIQYADLTRPE
ncbi:MAG: hypothetical protein CUN49_18330, partial [Candidatus Thermofonsia Clade 1 bacterium]